MRTLFAIYVPDHPASHWFAGWSATGEPVWVTSRYAAHIMDIDETWAERAMLRREVGDTLRTRLVATL